MTIWVLIEAAVCCVLFLARRRLGFFAYQLSLAFVYLLALTMEQTLDYTMSVYFLFSVVPYVRYVRCKSKLDLFLVLYFALITMVSVVSNGFVPVASSLIIHYLGPLALIFMFLNVPEELHYPSGRENSTEDSCRYVLKTLVFAMFIEAAVGVLAIALSPDGRLMLNYQCVSGCVACVTIVLASFLLKHKYHTGFAYVFIAYMLVWSFASGTRGYIILAFAMAIFVVALQSDVRLPVVAGALVLTAICLVLICDPDIVQTVFSESRMGESVGRRTYENMWFVNMFESQGFAPDLFGMGIGTTYSTLPGSIMAFNGTGVDKWAFNAVLNNTTLHNFWYTMILSVGVFGFILFLCSFISFGKRLLADKQFGKARLLVVVFMLVYAFVLWFRWTATGGFLEAATLCTLLELFLLDSRKHASLVKEAEVENQ